VTDKTPGIMPGMNGAVFNGRATSTSGSRSLVTPTRRLETLGLASIGGGAAGPVAEGPPQEIYGKTGADDHQARPGGFWLEDEQSQQDHPRSHHVQERHDRITPSTIRAFRVR